MRKKEDEIEKDEGQFSSLKFPALINIYEYTGIPKFTNTEEGQILIEKISIWKERENNKSKKENDYLLLFKILLGLIPALILFLPFITMLIDIKKNIIIYGQIFFGVLFFIDLIMVFIYSQKIKKNKGEPILEKQKPYINYLQKILDNIKGNYLNEFRMFELGGWCFLFYSKLGCVCVDLISGNMVLYAKDNIKDVLLEHVDLGNTTVGSSNTSGDMYNNVFFNFHYKQYSDTDIETDSFKHYEWRLDILTDFLEFPKLSFRFPDNSKGEDEAKIIYGILKP